MKFRGETIGEKALQNMMADYIVKGRPIADLRRAITHAPEPEKWEEILRKAEKQAKSRQMAEVSITHLVHRKLAGTGLQYRLQPQKLRVSVFLKLHGNQQLQIALSHKNFMNQIDRVIETACMIDKLIQEAGQPVRMRTASPRFAWIDPESPL